MKLPDKVDKILVFRSCCLGDVVMLTPVICNLHAHFPKAEIKIASSTWIFSKKGLNLLPYLPYIDEAILYDAPFEKSVIKGLAKTIKFIFTLRKEKFDLVFLSNRHSIYGLIMKLAGIKHRLGFDETKHMNVTAPYEHGLHFVHRHNKVLESAGIKDGNNNLKLIPKRSKADIAGEAGLTGNNLIVGVFPFGGTNPGTMMRIKQWEYAKYIGLVNSIAEKHSDITVIFFEGHIEQERVSEEFKSKHIKKLKISFDLISACDIFISGDTGPLFVAEGFGVSTLSIFGPTDASKVAPQSKTPGVIHKVIWKKPDCSPCYTAVTAFKRDDIKYWNGNTFICNTGTHICISSISVGEVSSELENMMSVLTGNRN
ncbi:MAG: glycosyltransferase family 9 protein [Ignavibacteria bacterium]|nr:glycosyltransferase family 9 protein [Ignavibacteria bacterium]